MGIGKGKSKTTEVFDLQNGDLPGLEAGDLESGGASKTKVKKQGEGEEEEEEKQKLVPFRKLFFTANSLDKFYIFWAIISSLAHGVAMPLFIVFFGDVITAQGFDSSTGGSNYGPGLCFDPLNRSASYMWYQPVTSEVVINATTNATANVTTNQTIWLPCGPVLDQMADASLEMVSDSAMKILYISVASFVTSYFQVALFTITAQRQALRIRHRYFRALVRQEGGFYDAESSGALASRIASDIPKIQEAIGDKLGSCLQFVGMFLGGIGVGFAYSWQLTLVIFSVLPLLILGGAIMAKMIGEASGSGQGYYSKAGAIADETLRMIRTVIAFGTHKHEEERYEKELHKAMIAGQRAGRVSGLGMGFFMGILFASYALTFFYGSELVRNTDMKSGDVITVFFAVIMGAMSIGQAAPSITAFATGKGAAYKVLSVIDRVPEIDSLSEEGAHPEELMGELSFRNIEFTYPTRPEEPVLQGLDFVVKPNETVALVGESGCGKSTVFGLLERFYNPAKGSIALDGTDLRDLNISWLRSQIALVSQQPVLFPQSIAHNIGLGKDNATQAEIEAAAKMSNAHDFIMSFPQGYDTLVGDAGAQLSGGQKQRIAIARALVKRPHILLLDEATSALDNESERDVQAALDDVANSHTTLVIAHRLSTVFSADKIVVIRQGVVQEQGAPQELVDRGGAFYHMVAAQYGSGKHGEKFDLSKLANLAVETGDKGASAVAKKAAKVNKASAEDDKKKDSEEDKEEDLDKEELEGVKASMMRWAWGLNTEHNTSMMIGVSAASIEGFVWPAYSILLGDIIYVLIDKGHTLNDIAVWCFAFLGLAAAVFIAIFLKLYLITRASEALTYRLRKDAYHIVISQEASWYDAPEHSKGVLTTRLAEDASAVRGLLGERFGVFVTSAATIVGGLGVAFYFCWSVALVVLGCFPVVAIGGALQFKMVTGFASDKHFEDSGKFAGDVVENVRTVAALGRLNSFVQQYTDMLAAPSRKMHKTAHVQGLAFGFTEFSLLGIWALAFWFGATQVQNETCASFDDMFKSIMAIVFMAMITGQMQALAPDAAKAQKGAKRLYLLTKKQEELDRIAESEAKKGKPDIQGEIEFKDIEFVYPSRPDAKVLQGLNLKVSPGQTVALVGKSGCGKSTAVALIEQLYQPNAGQIMLDGAPLTSLNASWVRQHIAYVTQQPELFSLSIGDNIRYGLDDVTQEQVEEAARQANAHDFIVEFADGYDTMVGEKGTQLSGGQRQRIAIARALVRSDQMKILLLDEASSALDTKSEQLVHEALERFRKGRSTIMIAHRLSTIRAADKICVIDNGVCVEEGTHDELMAKRRVYYDLLASQGQINDSGAAYKAGAASGADREITML